MYKLLSFAKILLIIFAGLLFYSCSNKTISENKFVAVYCDMTIAHDTLSAGDFIKEKEAILKRNNVTEKELQATYDEYYQTPKKWDPFFAKALARVEKMRKNQPI